MRLCTVNKCAAVEGLDEPKVAAESLKKFNRGAHSLAGIVYCLFVCLFPVGKWESS